MGKTVIRAGLMGAATLALAASAASNYKPFRPAERATSAPVDEVTQKAARLLTGRGFTVDSAVNGLVTSEWRAFSGTVEGAMGDTANIPQGRWVIQVANGIVTVDLQCQYANMTPCGEKRPGDWQTQADSLADELTRP